MKHTDLVCEMQGDVLYEYYPIGQYIVAAPGVRWQTNIQIYV